MSEFDSATPIEEQMDALEQSFANASGVAASFDAELKRIQGTFEATGRNVQSLDVSLSKSLKGAFEDVLFDGKKLSDALKDIGRSMTNTALNAAIKPVTSHVSGLLTDGVGGLVKSLLPFANGAPLSQGRVVPFANGGIVSGPTAFPMRGATGLMGEAGPEAIMPLTRGADGKLGVQAAGGGGAVNVTMHITTPDAEGFRRSQSQIAAQMSRLMSRSQRAR
ncbi:MAG: phage tail tape measure protein [Pseudomonadota bacterium]